MQQTRWDISAVALSFPNCSGQTFRLLPSQTLVIDNVVGPLDAPSLRYVLSTKAQCADGVWARCGVGLCLRRRSRALDLPGVGGHYRE